ncbi:MAG: hypothetical protein EXS13_03710 [Planctomycetes bacterium]|nr:hypothetical protein [Planctomycetota bacterium]
MPGEGELPSDPSAQALNEAIAAFSNALNDVQAEALADVEARASAVPDSPLLRLRKRAQKELKLTPRPPTPFHAPSEFTAQEATRNRLVRTPADPEGADYADKRGRFMPWLNQPPLGCAVRWNFGTNRAESNAEPQSPPSRLWNVLNGYAPDSDTMVAWLLSEWDFEKTQDAPAAYFGHAYCDLSGRAYLDITLYDAWSSGAGMDMPDVDTIAFARKLLRDTSYVAPLPADAHRQKLYDAISASFLDYFKYRIWIESAAWIFVNPEADVLREAHEPMRRRLLYLFGQEDGDVDRIGERLKKMGTRDRFIEEIDAAIQTDDSTDKTIGRFTKERAEERWAVARAAHTALRARQLLTD